MENSTQTEVRELTLDELRKVTWDYTESNIIGLYQGEVVTSYQFRVKNPGDIHPFVIQKCNVEEGWIEHIVCEMYPATENAAQFFTEADIQRDENDKLVTVRKYIHGGIQVDITDALDNVILTLEKE